MTKPREFANTCCN